jgi:GPH family glycoside/pentoside/hexuronide:cation symporter
MLFGVIAYMIGAAGTPFFVGLFANERTGYLGVGIVYGIICTLVLWISASGVKEKEEANRTRTDAAPLASFFTAMRNKPFQQLILAYLIAQLGFTLVQTLLAYFLTYQLGMEEAVPLVMLLLLGSVLLFLFPWKALADRWNKGPAYGAGLAIAALAVAATFLLPHHPTPLIYVVAVVAGIGFSANWVFPWAMIPDVVEFDQVETGEARGGMYYGVWGFTSKLIAALAITISGWTLQLSGYIPNVAQSETTLLAIRICFALVPAVFFLISVPFLVRYPITRQSHANVVEKLNQQD